MNEDERYREICKPTLEGIRNDLDLLKKHLILGNGKPSLLNRVDSLEQRFERTTASPKDARSLSIGKFIVLKGYGANDVARLLVLIGVGWLVLEPVVKRLIK